jgi:O-Antigen ligase
MVGALPVALAVLTAGLYLRWPRAIPLVLTGAVLFPASGVPIALDVATLSGLMLGILVDLVRQRDTTALNAARTPLWIPFVAFVIVLVASAIANHSAYDWPEHVRLVRDTKWFVFRIAGVLVAVVLTARRRGVGLDCWATSLIWMALVLVGLRGLQAAGFDWMWASDALGLQVFSDLRVTSAYNGYGSFLALALPLAVAGAIRANRRVPTLVYWVAAFVLTAGFFQVQSRTASLVVALELGAWLVFSNTLVARLAILGLAATYVGITEFDPTPILQTAVLAHRRVPSDTDLGEIRTGLAASGEGGGAKAVDSQRIWRAPLIDPSHRLVQRLRAPSLGEGRELRVYVRRGLGGSPSLGIRVDGRPMARISDLPEGDFQWVSVPLPADAIRGEWTEIEVEAIGELDAVQNYLEVGGVALRSPDILSSYRNGAWNWDGDLSWDAGRQDGVFLVLLNGTGLENAVPLPAPPDASLDQSLSDRVELWRAAALIAATHPWLGTGYYTFRVQSSEMLKGRPRFFEYANAHNAFLQAAADLGLLGLGCFLGIFGASFWALRARGAVTGRGDPLPFAVGLAVMSVLMSSATQTWFADSRYCLAVWIVFAMVVVLDLQRRGWIPGTPVVPPDYASVVHG